MNKSEYKKAMIEWGKACAKWQLENPDKDLVTELAGNKAKDIGSNPPQPPPPPPGHG